MISVYLPNHSSGPCQGGGWTFRRNLRNGLEQIDDAEVVDRWEDCDVILISGATMTERDPIKKAVNNGKDLTFRVDNIPKDSRNRGTAFSRVRDFAQMAEHIIFQSEWAKMYAGWWFKNNLDIENMESEELHSVIYNGVNKDHFFYDDDPSERDEVYSYIQWNKNRIKRFPEACYRFHMKYRENKDIKLFLVGRFSRREEKDRYNWDFFAGEDVQYLPPVKNPADMGDLMRSFKYLYFPAFADACPNTVIEALNCGLEILAVNEVGGTKEIVEKYNKEEDWPSNKEMAQEYLDIFKQINT